MQYLAPFSLAHAKGLSFAYPAPTARPKLKNPPTHRVPEDSD